MSILTTTPRKLIRFRFPLKTEAQLRGFVLKAFGARIPNRRRCAKHSTPWRAFADAYFARHPMAIWEGSRGFAGKSYLLSLLGLTEAVTLKADVNVLGGSGEQSERVLEYMEQFWLHKSAPRHLLIGEVKREQRLVYGNKIRSLMASSRSVRGPHPQRLRLDEIDEMEEDIFEASLGQTMSKPGIPAPPQTVGSSTHHYPNGTMTAAKKLAGEKNWPIYEWCYRESLEPEGWLTRAEVRLKKTMVPMAMWLSEYELQEPSPEDRAIDTEAVDRMFDEKLGVFDGRERERIAIEAPRQNGKYCTGADWARKRDWTEIGTLRLDVKPLLLVAYERMNRLPWPVMVGAFDRRVKRYKGGAAHDGTGLGDVVDGYITVDATCEILVGRHRTDLLSNVIAAIERDEIRSPMIKSLHSQLKFCTVDDVYGTGHLPDGLSMLAVAYNEAVNGRQAWTGRN